MYKQWTYITDPIWNNEFSYQERIGLWSVGKIFVPSLIKWNLDNLEIGSEIVFEEVMDNKLISCTWLKHLVETTYAWIPVYIMDNHNHALFFRYRHTKQLMSPLIKGDKGGFKKEDMKPFAVIHIDQHADTKENINSFNAKYASPQEVLNFTNVACNVGNFITSAKDAGIIDEIIQIRTDYALHNLKDIDFQKYNYILDIDVDFRVGKEFSSKDIELIHALIKNSCLITIATSPYFIDQKEAIAIIKKILS